MKTIYLAPLFLILSLVLIKTQHTVWTEMLVYPYLLNHGFVLYKDLIAPYTPLALWLLQITEKLWGYTPELSFNLTWAWAVVNTFLVWLISKKIWKKEILGLIAAGFYVLWFTYFEGNGLWFELFQTPLVIGSFYFLWQYFFTDKKRVDLWLGSILLAVSFFIKQSASWLLLITLLWLFFSTKSWKQRTKQALVLVTPFIALFIITSLVTSVSGFLSDYWSWAFVYTFLQFPFTAGHDDYPSVTQLAKLAIPLAGLLPLILGLRKEKESIFALLFLAATFMAALPRWGLFHLQPFLAITAILTSPFLLKWIYSTGTWKRIAFAVVLLIWVLVAGRQVVRFWDKPTRFFEPEIYKVTELVETKGYRNLFIFNGPDQLYVLTGVVPKVKPYVQNFAWYMEVPGMQERVVKSLEEMRPEYIAFSPFSGAGGYKIGDYEPVLLSHYIKGNYVLKEKLTENIWILERKK